MHLCSLLFVQLQKLLYIYYTRQNLKFMNYIISNNKNRMLQVQVLIRTSQLLLIYESWARSQLIMCQVRNIFTRHACGQSALTFIRVHILRARQSFLMELCMWHCHFDIVFKIKVCRIKLWSYIITKNERYIRFNIQVYQLLCYITLQLCACNIDVESKDRLGEAMC